MSEQEIPKQSEESTTAVAGPSARTVQIWTIALTLLVAGVTLAAQLTLPVLEREGTDPGAVLMVRALAGSLLAMLIILVYVLGWTELFQGWRQRGRGANIFFTVALILINVLGAVLLCVFDPWLRRGPARPQA